MLCNWSPALAAGWEKLQHCCIMEIIDTGCWWRLMKKSHQDILWLPVQAFLREGHFYPTTETEKINRLVRTLQQETCRGSQSLDHCFPLLQWNRHGLLKIWIMNNQPGDNPHVPDADVLLGSGWATNGYYLAWVNIPSLYLCKFFCRFGMIYFLLFWINSHSVNSRKMCIFPRSICPACCRQRNAM